MRKKAKLILFFLFFNISFFELNATCLLKESIFYSQRRCSFLLTKKILNNKKLPYYSLRTYNQKRFSICDENIISAMSHQKQDYLYSISQTVRNLSNKWGINLIRPFLIKRYNGLFVGFKKDSGIKVILKIGISEKTKEIYQESLACSYFGGYGCTTVLESDKETNSYLREFVDPGISLQSLFANDDLQACFHAASVIKKIHFLRKIKNEKNSFPTTQEWLNQLEHTENPFIPQVHLERAITLASDLISSQDRVVLLHGDLHHGNIVFCKKNGWISLDPKGVFGDPIYDIASFIRNPVDDIFKHPKIEALLAQRISFFTSIFGVNEKRLKDWAYVQSVLSACWALEDQEDFSDWLKLADLFSILKNN